MPRSHPNYRPGLVTDDPIDPESSVPLKLPHCLLGSRPEDPVNLHRKSVVSQEVLDGPNILTTRAEPLNRPVLGQELPLGCARTARQTEPSVQDARLPRHSAVPPVTAGR